MDDDEMWDPFSQKQYEKLLSIVYEAQNLYNRKPRDTENLKTWASAMVDLEFMTPAVILEDKEWLQDAKLKLEEVLEIDPVDYNTMFELGMVHYYILENCPPRKHTDLYMKLCNEAISYFKEVRNKIIRDFASIFLEYAIIA